jgi:uncharacterized protein YukE
MASSGGSGAPNRVGHEEMLTAANNLEELMHRALDVLHRYMQHSQDLQASQMLTGAAGDTNIVTTEEISNAGTKIQTRWGHLIDTLRGNTHGYIQADDQNASNIGGVAGGLSHV